MLLHVVVGFTILFLVAAVPVLKNPKTHVATVQAQEQTNSDLIDGLILENQLMQRYRQWGTLPTVLTKETMQQMGLPTTTLDKIVDYSWDAKTKIFYLRLEINDGAQIWLSPHSGEVLP